MVICQEQGTNDLHIVKLMPSQSHHLLLHYNPECFNFLVLAYPGCPGKEVIKWISVAALIQFLFGFTLIC